jgi:hypothetical protein
MKTLVLALTLLALAPAGAQSAEAKKPILVTMNQVVDKLLPKILAQQQSPRVTLGRGILGIGTFAPAGWWESGSASVPLKLVPTAGVGTSLNINPVTGRPY